jgi:hypothetical protein
MEDDMTQKNNTSLNNINLLLLIMLLSLISCADSSSGGSDNAETASGGDTIADTAMITWISLNKSSSEIIIGGMEVLEAAVTPVNADKSNLKWSSSDESIASVSSSGVVIAENVGIAVISVSSEDSSLVDMCEITVFRSMASLEWSLDDAESSPGSFEINGTEPAEGPSADFTAYRFYADPAELSYILISDSEELTLRNKGTIEVWVKADSIKPFAGIVSKGQSKTFEDEAYGIQLFNYEGSPARLMFFLYNDAGSYIAVNGTFDILTDSWYHIVAAWDENSMKLFVNGILDGERVNTTGGVRDTAGGLTIGAQLSEIYNSTYGNLAWDGVISGVSVLSDMMQQDEVEARYLSVVNQP